MTSKLVFLGGTCGQNQWRTGLIERLRARGVAEDAIFNPQLPPGAWNEEAAKKEDEMKGLASISLYHLGNPLEEQRPPPIALLADPARGQRVQHPDQDACALRHSLS